MIRVTSAIGTVMNSMIYAVTDGLTRHYYLIDIGDFDAVKRLLPAEAIVCGVFITHGHHDHILGLNKLVEAFPECKVYSSEECVRMLSSSKANLSAYVERPFTYRGKVTILNDGDIVELFNGIVLTAISTPGHNPSCMCFQIGHYIFTGDSYIPGVKVVTNLPGGNKRKAQDSVKKILELSQDSIICPGHGNIER